MLQFEGGLRTWRLPPEFDLDSPIPAEAIAKHRNEYLEYEGPLSGDRGQVRRWDSGAMVYEQIEDNRLVVLLVGHKLCGRFELKTDGVTSQWILQRTQAINKSTT